MIELFEQNERKNSIQSSKGNQLKWGNENYWYKADYTGYSQEEKDRVEEIIYLQMDKYKYLFK